MTQQNIKSFAKFKEIMTRELNIWFILSRVHRKYYVLLIIIIMCNVIIILSDICHVNQIHVIHNAPGHLIESTTIHTR